MIASQLVKVSCCPRRALIPEPCGRLSRLPAAARQSLAADFLLHPSPPSPLRARAATLALWTSDVVGKVCQFSAKQVNPAPLTHLLVSKILQAFYFHLHSSAQGEPRARLVHGGVTFWKPGGGKESSGDVTLCILI